MANVTCSSAFDFISLLFRLFRGVRVCDCDVYHLLIFNATLLNFYTIIYAVFEFYNLNLHVVRMIRFFIYRQNTVCFGCQLAYMFDAPLENSTFCETRKIDKCQRTRERNEALKMFCEFYVLLCENTDRERIENTNKNVRKQWFRILWATVHIGDSATNDH